MYRNVRKKNPFFSSNYSFLLELYLMFSVKTLNSKNVETFLI